MQYNFKVPNIKDDQSFLKMFKPGCMKENEFDEIVAADELRKKFKNLIFDQLQHPIHEQSNLMENSQTYEQYISKHSRVLELVLMYPCVSGSFVYDQFLTRDSKEIKTQEFTKEFGVATEMIFSRYLINICFQREAQYEINNFVHFIPGTLVQDFKQIPDDLKQSCVKSSKTLSMKLFKGYVPFNKLISVMDEVIWFMADDGSKKLSIEQKTSVMFAFKLISEQQANSFLCEMYRIHGQLLPLAMLCKKTIGKLVQVQQRINIQNEQNQDQIIDSLGNYVKFSKLFFMAYGFWALLKSNAGQIDIECFEGNKNFTICTKESLALANEIKVILGHYQKLDDKSSGFGYGMNFFTTLFIPLAGDMIKKYGNLHQNFQEIKSMALLQELGETQDAFEKLEQSQKK